MAAKESSRREISMIPEDLVIEILLQLPMASLLRFKSVCKSWLSLIESPQFVSRHLQLSNSSSCSENRLVVSLFRYRSFIFDFISVNDLQLSRHVEFVPRMADRHNKNWCGKLIASFNGILCIKDQTSDLRGSDGWVDVVSLWNPATKELRTLPQPRYEVKEVELYPRLMKIEYGFGLDVKTNDYKVVRIILERRPNDSVLRRSHVEVYSLSRDSWRIVDSGLPPNVCDITYNPRNPFENENYCWMGCCNKISQHYYSILCFNFSSEAFRIIPVPEVYANDSECRLHVAFLRDKIACIDWVFGGYVVNNNRCTTWVLDEFGVKESWTKLYTVTLDTVYPGFLTDGAYIFNTNRASLCAYDPPPSDFYPAMEFSIDRKIVLKKNLVKLCIYDTGTEEIKEVPTSVSYVSSAAGYKESLVSVKRVNGATTDGQIYDVHYH